MEKICNLDEYYVMRVESKLLRTHANDIAKYTASTMRLVELGSGASIKTQIILDAMGADARPIEYMPVDISKVIGENCMYLLDAYDEITVKGIVDTYEKGLELVKNLDHTPSLIAFLGSSLGNMNPEIALEFLRTVRSCMRKGDLFLIGLDLNKSADILHAAYDDASGITAKFNKNILHRINSELGADFDLEQFEHHVVYDEKQMRTRCLVFQCASVSENILSSSHHMFSIFSPACESINLIESGVYLNEFSVCIISSFSNTVRMPDFGIDTVCLCIDFRYIPTRICFSSYTT